MVGGGISGLSCGIRLLERGVEVELWAAELSPHTTADVAPAFWYPFLAGPPERVAAWCARSYPVFRSLAEDPETGVTPRETVELFLAETPDPAWAPVVDGFRHLGEAERPPGRGDGWSFRSLVIETPRYMPWLRRRFEALGGRIETRALDTLDEALDTCPIVVNTTGLGARGLVHDDRMFAVRGQLVRVRQTGVDRVTLDKQGEAGVAYVIPRRDDTVLGVTAEDSESTEVDPATTAAIVERCQRVEPRLAGAEVLDARVGLRPCRDEVRLEVERLPGGRAVVHDYGHGGAGVTLSWACADEVCGLVLEQG